MSKFTNKIALVKASLFTVVILSTTALPAFAGKDYLGTPRYRGTEVFDITPWEWNGNNWTEQEAKQIGASLVCQHHGYEYSLDYEDTKGRKGTWRFHTDGSVEWCDFCEWYITSLTCYKK